MVDLGYLGMNQMPFAVKHQMQNIWNVHVSIGGLNGQESDHLTNPSFRFELTLAIGFMYLALCILVIYYLCISVYVIKLFPNRPDWQPDLVLDRK